MPSRQVRRPVTASEEELVRWGMRVGERVEPGVFITLRGPLGAGKSVLARAVARGAGVTGPIPSPTFNLVFRYPAREGVEVVHLDLYRLRSPDELLELGWDELGADGEIVLVEWPERAGDALPPDRWDVVLRAPRDQPDSREVSVERVGSPPHLPGFPIDVLQERRS